jgi:hypothetical protein
MEIPRAPSFLVIECDVPPDMTLAEYRVHHSRGRAPRPLARVRRLVRRLAG